jgi:hypothetical protein
MGGVRLGLLVMMLIAFILGQQGRLCERATISGSASRKSMIVRCVLARIVLEWHRCVASMIDLPPASLYL